MAFSTDGKATMSPANARDVYAGDNLLADEQRVATSNSRFLFTIEADADPTTLLRIVSQLMLSNRVPRRVAMAHTSEDFICVEAELRDISEATVESIRRKLLQLQCIESVRIE